MKLTKHKILLVLQIFYTIDQDKSGVIDVEELHTYLRLNKFDEFFTSVSITVFCLLLTLPDNSVFWKYLIGTETEKFHLRSTEKLCTKSHILKSVTPQFIYSTICRITSIPFRISYATWHDVLHKVDKDQNGYITMVELYEMLHESGDSEKIDMKDLQSFIREYDHDGDGKLNYHEFLHYILDSSNTKT
ncbi:hypothetical protein PHET_10007 [Paragonimus heterotremus]|uniref:EF-hand domain-containing protein n=1 Tax=Paragonimus heterotremus TaxID=100268 RepID=A0A8J4SZ81_9TREM|nr:hypothetical protein PHET_10007 [Paragonimus heterotremus]